MPLRSEVTAATSAADAAADVAGSSDHGTGDAKQQLSYSGGADAAGGSSDQGTEDAKQQLPYSGGAGPAGRLLASVAEVRDAAVLLSGERPYREFPLSWYVDAVSTLGLEVVDTAAFPAGAYIRPYILLNVSTLGEMSRLTSVCLWQKRLRWS